MPLPRTCSLAFLILYATFSGCWPSHASSCWNSAHLEFVAGNRLPSSWLVSAGPLALQHAEPSQLSEPWLHRRPARFLLLAHVAARDCGCAYPLLVPELRTSDGVANTSEGDNSINKSGPLSNILRRGSTRSGAVQLAQDAEVHSSDASRDALKRRRNPRECHSWQ